MNSLEPAKRALRVAFVDPHAFTRQSICELMRRNGLYVIGVADVEEATTHAHAAGERVDAVVLRLDAISPHDRRLVSDLHALHRLWPGAPLLALAPFAGTEAAFEAVGLGFSGCLSPAMTASDMAAALRLVAAGGLFIGPSRMGGARHVTPAPLRIGNAVPTLTPREAEVMAMLRQGKPNKMIAFELDMAENTVKVHVARILKKFGAANRTAVANLESDFAAARAGSRNRVPPLQ